MRALPAGGAAVSSDCDAAGDSLVGAGRDSVGREVGWQVVGIPLAWEADSLEADHLGLGSLEEDSSDTLELADTRGSLVQDTLWQHRTP